MAPAVHHVNVPDAVGNKVNWIQEAASRRFRVTLTIGQPLKVTRSGRLEMRSGAWFLAPMAMAVFAAAAPGCGDDTTNPGTGGSAGTGGSGGSASTSTSTLATGGGGGATGGGGSGATGGGGSGATGGGGSGGAPPDSDDVCPGQLVTVAVDSSISVSGSTTGKASDYIATCNGANSGADAVYRFVPDGDGVLTATLTPAGAFDGVLYARTTCDDAASQVFCRDQGTPNETVQIPVSGGTPYFFFVDSKDTATGDFSLDFALAAPSCGDGFVTPPEECDNGTNLPGSGCLPGCILRPPPDTSDNCPGAAAQPLLTGQDIDIGMPPADAHTTGYSDDFTAWPCDGTPTAAGRDRIFHFVPAANGSLLVELRNIGPAGGFDGKVGVWTGACTDFPANVGTATFVCADLALGDVAYDAADPNTFDAVDFGTVSTGQDVFVIVDGYETFSEGQFWLHVELN